MAVNVKPPQVKLPTPLDKYAEHLTAHSPEAKPDQLVSPGITGSVVAAHVKNNYGDKVVTPIMEEKTSEPSGKIPLDKLCNLNVGGKMTINLGNYESAQIHCSLTVPCTKETLEEAYEYASAWVSEKIESTVAKAKKGVA